MINLRRANVSDAGLLSEFIQKLDKESKYLLYDPHERSNDMNVVRAYLEKIDKNERSAVFIAESDHNQIVGFVCGEVSHLSRIKHVMKANIGVLSQFQRNGIAELLGIELIEFAKKTGITRIEVSLIKGNTPSFNYSLKLGFDVEGIKKNSIKIDDKFHDEYIMAKLLMDH